MYWYKWSCDLTTSQYFHFACTEDHVTHHVELHDLLKFNFTLICHLEGRCFFQPTHQPLPHLKHKKEGPSFFHHTHQPLPHSKCETEGLSTFKHIHQSLPRPKCKTEGSSSFQHTHQSPPSNFNLNGCVSCSQPLFSCLSRSGFFSFFGSNQDQNQLAFVPRPKITELDWR